MTSICLTTSGNNARSLEVSIGSVKAGAHNLRSSSMSIQALYGIFLAVLFLGSCRISFAPGRLRFNVPRNLSSHSEEKGDVSGASFLPSNGALSIRILIGLLFCGAVLGQPLVRHKIRTLWRRLRWPEPVSDEETSTDLLILPISLDNRDV